MEIGNGSMRYTRVAFHYLKFEIMHDGLNLYIYRFAMALLQLLNLKLNFRCVPHLSRLKSMECRTFSKYVGASRNIVLFQHEQRENA